jgi:hypothetical protein
MMGKHLMNASAPSDMIDMIDLLNESIFSQMPNTIMEPPDFFRAYLDFKSGVVWDVWNINRVEGIEAAVCQGVMFADQLMRCAKANRCPDIIQHVLVVLLTRIERGSLRFGTVEFTFFRRLAHLAYLAKHD